MVIILSRDSGMALESVEWIAIKLCAEIYDAQRTNSSNVCEYFYWLDWHTFVYLVTYVS